MIERVKITTIYNCSLERAFKTPMLCDVSKVHTGFGIMPKVTHCTNDENWRKKEVLRKFLLLNQFLKKEVLPRLIK